MAIRPARVTLTVPPYDDPFSYRGDDWDLLGQDIRHDAGILVGSMVDDTRDVHAWHLTDKPELQDSADGRVLWVACESLPQRKLLVWQAPVGLLQGIHQRDGIADPEFAEVDDDVVALRGALLIDRPRD